MSFGAEFDDEIFEKPKVKSCQLEPIRQGAKICESEWFLKENIVHKDCEDHLKCLKFKADFFYFNKKYTEACVMYNQYMNLLPKSNLPARRESMENLARSYLHQDNLDKALEWALQMHAASISADQKLSSWNLLAVVCHRLKKYEEELEALHCCVAMHKSVPDFWLRLAYCYSGLFQLDLPCSGQSSATSSNSSYCCSFKSRVKTVLNRPDTSSNSDQVQNACSLSNENNNELSTSDDACKDQKLLTDETVPKCDMCDLGSQMISACLIRTRVLLSNSDRSPLSQLKNAQMNETITECLTYLEVDQLFIEEATKVLKLEMYSNQLQVVDENTPTESSSSHHTKTEDTGLEEKMNSIQI